MRTLRTLLTGAVTAAGLLGLGGELSTAEAVSCGDTIAASTTLTADLGPCATDPVLTVVGPATLDLNGFTVSCDTGAEDGLLIQGSGATVKNGVVTGCNVGVRLENIGKHQVMNVLATGNTGPGFQVAAGSDKNRFTYTAAIGNSGRGYDVGGPLSTDKSNKNKFTSAVAVDNTVTSGFYIIGDGNKLKDCSSIGNGLSGFELTGDKNSVKDSAAEGNTAGSGFGVTGDKNKVSRCIAANHAAGAGFLVGPGDGNKLSKNHAASDWRGYVIRGSNTKLSNSTTTNSGAYGVYDLTSAGTLLKKVLVANSGSDGIHIEDSTATIVQDCWVEGSGGAGIENDDATPATGLTVMKNVVLASTGNDMQEDNVVDPCATHGNTWMKNISKTRSDPCIEAPPAGTAVACGANITGKVVMDADLDCSTHDGDAITIDGGELDMNGHTLLSCKAGYNGIVLTGTGSKLNNGVVTNCFNGVLLAGAGSHKVANVLSKSNQASGFRVALGADKNGFVNTSATANGLQGYYIGSENNKLRGASAAENDEVGLYVAGNGNKLRTCTTYHNDFGGTFTYAGLVIMSNGNQVAESAHFGNNSDAGAFLINGDGNKVSRCFAGQSGGDGFQVSGTGNKLSKSIAMDTDDGFFLTTATETKLEKSVAVRNQNGVVALSDTDSSVKKVRVVGNIGVGFWLDGGSGTEVQGCVVMDSGTYGIANNGVAPSTGITVTKNVVVRSATEDMHEAPPDCATHGNKWTKNVFGTVNYPSCIK